MINDRRFHALNQEMRLATHAVCAGVTALHHASAARSGSYSEAFFNLSIGIERLIKLALVIDHCLSHAGTFPVDKDLRDKGHDIEALFNEAKAIRARYSSTEPLAQIPNDAIVDSIVLCLSEFGKATRYYNLDYLVGGRTVSLGDPIVTWADRVIKPVLERHYRPTRRERDSVRAGVLGQALDTFTKVVFTAEDGSTITDSQAMLKHSSQTRVVQAWTPLYVLKLVRFLSFLLIDIHYETVQRRFEFVPWVGEYLGMFCNEDRYLRSRKAWKLPG